MESSNPEDNVELETQLYGQIQHQQFLEQTEPSASYKEQRFQKARYWTQGRPYRGKKNVNPLVGLSYAKNSKSAKTEMNSKTELLSSSPLKSDDIPETSEVQKKVHSVKKSKSGNSYGVLAGPSNIAKHVKSSNRNMMKLAKVLKYQFKKIKASQSKEKQKKYDIETITLDSSDESDVVEIPLPTPVIVTIDSAEDTDGDLSSFLEPQIKHKISEKFSSRCVSPSSVISDDFIGHIDRSRLLEQKDTADDEDLIFLQESVGKFIYKRKSSTNCPPSRDNTQAGSYEAPKKSINIKEKPDYNVPHPNFRATDVYESESSDMPDCDQEAIRLHTKDSLDLDSQVKTTTDRTKKLPKRGTSSSVRESNINSSDTEDECDEEVVQSASQRETVEYKMNVIKDSVPISEDGYSSDNEFVSLLKNVSQPITMRRISNESKKLTSINTGNISTRKITTEFSPNTSEDKATNDAIPEYVDDIDKIFETIDKIRITNESVSITEESEPIEEYIGNDSIDAIKQSVDSGLHVVFSDEHYVCWTEEMKRFYNLSWGQEKFNVRNIRKMMNVSSNWMISSRDKSPKLKANRNLKCHNCCEFGHVRAKCPHPRKEPVCHMCGEKGHMEPRCPNTICLRCGHKTNIFTKCCKMCSHENKLTCPICNLQGHTILSCPDKWRRYHSTTEPNAYLKKTVFWNQNIYCCICAGQGHLSDDCQSALNFSEYPPTISEIQSYEKSYDDVLVKYPCRTMMGFSLLSRPCSTLLFKFSSKVTTKQYYGRFLNAVGLDYLMARNKSQNPLKHKSNEHVEGQPDSKTSKTNCVVNKFAQNIKKHKRHSKANPNSDKFEGISKALDEIAKDQKDIDQICKNVEVTFDENSQSKEPRENSGISYSKFSKNILNNCSTPYSKKKYRVLKILPDFIPINNSEMEKFLDKDMLRISKNAQPDWKEDSSKEDVNNQSCDAKLYLTEFQSTFLFSEEGNRFLRENCKKLNIKSKIEWTSAGRVLIIEGLPSDQDNFRKEFVNVVQKLSYKSKKQEVEKSQIVPKKREAVIKFLQHHLSQLEKNLGNVENLYKHLQAVQNQKNKNAWKEAERTRRVLNMILIGQTGLKEGKANLQAIINKVNILKESVNMDVPDNTRREIYEHWRYIFSSQQHQNYEDLIQQYRELKKAKELPKLEISRHLLGEEVLDISLTDEQKQKLDAESSLQTNVKIIVPNEDVKNGKNDVDLAKESCLHLQPSTKNFHIQGKGFKPRSFIAEQIQGVNNNWRHRCRNLINRLDVPHSRRFTPTHFREQANLKAPSIFWSRESMKFIDKCLAMNPSTLSIVSKLERVQEKAKQGLLSRNDYRAILQIHNAFRGALT